MPSLRIVVILFGILCTGCTNTKPLLDDRGNAHCYDAELATIKIDAPYPAVAYKIKRNLISGLRAYGKRTKKYKININVSITDFGSVFSKSDVVKESIRMSAMIEVLDENYNRLIQTNFDAHETYEVNDDAPYASISSRENSIDALTNEISTEVLNILSGLK